MEKKKKTWREPNLTVLVKSKPEEGILNGCKTPELPQGADNYFDGCWVVTTCWNCFDTSGS